MIIYNRFKKTDKERGKNMKEELIKRLEELASPKLVSVWNKYCEANNYVMDYIEYNDPNMLFAGKTVSYALSHIGECYSYLDDYAQINEITEEWSSSDDALDFVELDDLAEWLERNFSSEEIDELIDD